MQADFCAQKFGILAIHFSRFMALSATFRKMYKQNMFKLISYIQVKSLVADTLYTIFVYCIFVYTGKKCVSY